MYNYNGYNAYANPYMANYNKGLPNYQQQLQQQLLQQTQQPMMQQPMQVNQHDMPIQGIKFLTADEIKAYIVMPNTKEMLIDIGNGVAYIKSADTMGQSSVKMYEFKETTEEKQKEVAKAETKPDIDLSNYVQKEDIDGFMKRSDLDALSKSINDKLDKLEKKIKISEIMGE